MRILNRYTFSRRVHDIITGVPFQPLYGVDEIEEVIQYQVPPTPPPPPTPEEPTTPTPTVLENHSLEETSATSSGCTGLAQDCIDQLNMVLYELNETVIKLNTIVQSLVRE